MSGKSLQIVLVAGAVMLAVGLYFAPSQVNSKPNTTVNAPLPAASFDSKGLIKTAKASLDEERKSYISTLEMTLSTHPDSIAVYDSLGKAWDRANIPAVAAYYFAEKAEKVTTEKSYLDAAYRYFDAFKIAADTTLRTYMVQQAIANYQKVLLKNPANLDAKTDLGVCYAEGTTEPMKGIMLLREVISTNPEHEMAQFNLGLLSLKSTQYAKAIERFDKVLLINPNHTDVYVYKGQTYLQMGDTINAIKSFELYKSKSDNYEMIQQVSKIIDQLKSDSKSKVSS